MPMLAGSGTTAYRPPQALTLPDPATLSPWGPHQASPPPFVYESSMTIPPQEVTAPSVSLPTTEMPSPTDMASQLVEARRQTNFADKQQSLYDKVAAKGGKDAGGTGFGRSAYGVTGKTGLDSQRGSAKYGLQPQMWSRLSQANAAMKAAGLGTFGITDGWRSYAAQVDVKRRKPTLAATPGTSVHGLGLAADLDMTAAQTAWLKKNGSRFGLVNLPSEAWHWQLDPRLA